LTHKEIGRRLGVTRDWVRKIQLRAIRKLGDNAAVYASVDMELESDTSLPRATSVASVNVNRAAVG
jgi:hypothetical protein